MARAANEAPLGVFFPNSAIGSTQDTRNYTAWFFTLPSYGAGDDFTACYTVNTNFVSKNTNQRAVGAANSDGALHFFMAYYSGFSWEASARDGAAPRTNNIFAGVAPDEVHGNHVVQYKANSTQVHITVSKGDYVYTSNSVVHSFAYPGSTEQVTFFSHGSRAMSQTALVWGTPTKPFVIHPMQEVTKAHKGAWNTYNNEFYTTIFDE